MLDWCCVHLGCLYEDYTGNEAHFPALEFVGSVVYSSGIPFLVAIISDLTLLNRYYSMYGHVEKLAEEIKKGASSVDGVEAKLHLWMVLKSNYDCVKGWKIHKGRCKSYYCLNFKCSCLCLLQVVVYRDLKPEVLKIVLLDLPGLLFFSTYTLLVLFWVDIYHQVMDFQYALLFKG
ncbi:hypothetical protein NE237_009186 [Protea cynaroides]|uniref:THH1/TOM1/TOM3 domain-containing protein n=1 Tax=Protea cynaroides TaxID=273540 RepID=A0A9Q0KXV1_9MAGN|nr:hypothetical protein NE237_009186 [Protea cynaroides]